MVSPVNKGLFIMPDQGEILDRLCDVLKQHINGQNDAPFVQYHTPEELARKLQLEKNGEEGSWAQMFFWIEKYLEYSVKTNHPGFVNRMWCGANLPSVLGEMVAAVSNTSSCTYESAPVSTLMEKYMLQEMLDLAGFTNGEGQMTTGSSNANMLAMMAARNERLTAVKTKGLFGQNNIFGFVSADAHYSLTKAANILGIGIDNLIRVPVNSRGEMDTVLLANGLQQIEDRGGTPFFVAGTAGTTVRGAYDSIAELLALRDKYSFWLHIDGAWGGAVLVSEKLRQRYMKGIEKVDSLTWDFHKMLGTSLMCNVFLINHRSHTLGKVCSGGDDSYLFHDAQSNDVHDLGAVSLQCGRRVDSLKWFLDWKFFGRNEFGRRVEYSLDLCRYAEQIVQESEHLELVVPRNSFNICFRFRAGKYSDNLTLAIREKLYHEGKSLVGYAYHDNRPFLRLLLANHQLSKDDVDNYFKEVIETGKSLEVIRV